VAAWRHRRLPTCVLPRRNRFPISLPGLSIFHGYPAATIAEWCGINLDTAQAYKAVQNQRSLELVPGCGHRRARDGPPQKGTGTYRASRVRPDLPGTRGAHGRRIHQVAVAPSPIERTPGRARFAAARRCAAAVVRRGRHAPLPHGACLILHKGRNARYTGKNGRTGSAQKR